MILNMGVLSLQGDFAAHQKHFKKIGCKTTNVRWPDELDHCDGLILPGGESTTLLKHLTVTGLFNAIINFSKTRPIMGTCAGSILLSTHISNDSLKPLGLIDMAVERNGYGRQIDSFIAPVKMNIFPEKPVFEGVFIRAPKIAAVYGKTNVLAKYQDEIVMVKNERILALTFHPELTSDYRLHRYFAEQMALPLKTKI